MLTLEQIDGKKLSDKKASVIALEQILYSGISSKSCGSIKSLLNTSSEVEDFLKIDRQFFSKNGAYQRFSKVSKSPESNQVQVQIDVPSLKEYLIEKNVLHKLSSGF